MSYGKGVRAQVFEVIVRQGMVGAPWREICAGPMLVNNIAPEEIQAEIDRRRGGGAGPLNPSVPDPPSSPDRPGPSGSPVPKKPLSPKDSGSVSLRLVKSAKEQMLVCLEMVESMIRSKNSANDDLQTELEKIRTELNTLSDLMIDEEKGKRKK